LPRAKRLVRHAEQVEQGVALRQQRRAQGGGEAVPRDAVLRREVVRLLVRLPAEDQTAAYACQQRRQTGNRLQRSALLRLRVDRLRNLQEHRRHVRLDLLRGVQPRVADGNRRLAGKGGDDLNVIRRLEPRISWLGDEVADQPPTNRERYGDQRLVLRQPEQVLMDTPDGALSLLGFRCKLIERHAVP